MAPMALDTPAAAPVATSHPLKAAASAEPFHQSLEGLNDNPLNRTWRGNKAGTMTLPTAAPIFGDDMLAKRQWIKEHLAAAFQFWGAQGYAEGVSGHITVRDSLLPDHYWMNPFGVHFSMITVSNLVLVTPEGFVSEHGAQLPINTSGFHIHSAIHKARPELQAAAHCHSLHGKAWSTFGRPIDIMTQDACLFHNNLGVYSNFGGLVLAQEEGANIAKAMGPVAKACILQNHGLMTAGMTVDEAVYLFSALDNQCKAQLLVEAAAANGIKKTCIDPIDADFTAKTLQHWENVYVNFQPYFNLLKRQSGDFWLN